MINRQKWQFSREAEELLMSKTVSVEKNGFKIKRDELDKSGKLEKEMEIQKNLDISIDPDEKIPLFRFEEKYRPILVDYIRGIVNVSKILVKNRKNDIFSLLPYIKILDYNDINHLIDLQIARNKEYDIKETNKIEIIIATVYYDKKLRIKLDIPEEKTIDENDIAYINKKSEIKIATLLFLEKLKVQAGEPNKVFKRRPEFFTLDVKEYDGDEDFGNGYVIYLKVEQKIDYHNDRRSVERLDLGLFGLEDAEYIANLTLKKEQNIIDMGFVKSMEAITDSLSEDEDGEGDSDLADAEETEDEPEDMGLGDEMEDPGDEGGDDGMVVGGDEGGGDMGGGDEGGDTGGDTGGTDLNPGEHPFTEINGRQKLSNEFKELSNQISLVINTFEAKNIDNSYVDSLRELKSVVEDARQIAVMNKVSVPSLQVRYKLYIERYKEIIDSYTRSLAK
jgi:hypothetical protein